MSIDQRLWSIGRPSARGAKPTLRRIRALLQALGNPQDRLHAVHVGGTAGKGSTAHMIASILRAAGYNEGLHAKPHLLSVTERFLLRGLPASEAELNAILERMLPALDELRLDGEAATWFELVVALCFSWFADVGASPVVIEVGLGGCWDATNVLQPLVTVITNVGLDHTEILGTHVATIAGEKAGIIKPDVPLVTGVTDATAWQVVEQAARLTGAPVWRLGDQIVLDVVRSDANGNVFSLQLPDASYDGLHTRMLGLHQAVNAALAVAAVQALVRQGYVVNEAAIRQGLETCTVPGRMTVVSLTPTVVLDGAHSPMKMRACVEALQAAFPNRRVVAVVAMRAGHDPLETLRPLAELVDAVVVTSLTQQTAMGLGSGIAEQTLVDALREARPDMPIATSSSSTEALQIALEQAGSNGVVCATGSLYLVGELLPLYMEMER